MPYEKIRELNDAFRRNVHNAAGGLMVTRGVTARGPEFLEKALTAVRHFDAFTADNDLEHDRLSIEVDGERLLFKIEYYDKNLRCHSDPADPSITRRVAVLMLADES